MKEVFERFDKQFQYQGEGKYYYGDNITSKWFAEPEHVKAFLKKEIIGAKIDELLDLNKSNIYEIDERIDELKKELKGE